VSRISRTIAIAAIAIAGFPASAMAADEADQMLAAMPPLKPSITSLRGPYAGIIGGGDSVAVGQRDGVTDLRNNKVSALGGIVAGYQWRAGMGPRQAFWGLETDIVSLDLLQGGQPGGPDWLATVRARYGINLVGNLSVYGTAGLAGYADHQASSRIKPALAAGAGIETAGANSIRTRLEYLYSHSLDGDVSHQVRAALLIGLR
jgi:opacity protein-like surface antigen